MRRKTCFPIFQVILATVLVQVSMSPEFPVQGINKKAVIALDKLALQKHTVWFSLNNVKHIKVGIIVFLYKQHKHLYYMQTL